MKKIVILISLLLLSSCGENPNIRRFGFQGNQPELLQFNPDQSVIVLGVAIHNRGNYAAMFSSPKPMPVEGGWIKYDPQTRTRLGKDMLVFDNGCVAGAAYCEATHYYAFRVDPGTYAFAWLLKAKNGSESAYPRYGGLNCFVQFKTCAVETTSYGQAFLPLFSAEATVPSNALTFAVGSNQVIYVGNLTFDFDKDSNFKLSISMNESEARKFMSVSNVADRLVVKPLQRTATSNGGL